MALQKRSPDLPQIMCRSCVPVSGFRSGLRCPRFLLFLIATTPRCCVHARTHLCRAGWTMRIQEAWQNLSYSLNFDWKMAKKRWWVWWCQETWNRRQPPGCWAHAVSRGLRGSQLSLWWQRKMKHYRDIPREETDVIQHLNRLFQKERCRSPYNSHKCEPADFFLLLKAGRTDSTLEIYSSVVLVA